MSASEIIKIAGAVIISLGGSGAIILGLSNFLGKIWAERLMQKERNKFEQELAALRSKLERENQENLSRLQTNLEIYRDKYLKQHSDKIGTYGYVFGVVADFLADLDMVRLGQKPDGNAYDRFNRGRLKAHGHLAMLAPQKVMDAWDAFVEHIFSTLEKNKPADYPTDWKEMRRLAYILINAIREDVGVDKTPVEYHGKR